MKKQIIGFSLIILSWIFWGLIFMAPFFNLGTKTTAAAIIFLLIATNIFWLGAYLCGKEFAKKYRVLLKMINWQPLNRRNQRS
jgi:hypothetical protein